MRPLVRQTQEVANRRGRLSAANARRLGVAAAIGAASVVLAACGGGASQASSTTATLDAGIAAQRANDFGTATTDYEKVLQSDPKNFWALYDLGDVEQFQNQDAAAQTHYVEALRIDPKFESAMYNLAILVTHSNPAEARSLYLEVVHLTPNYAAAHLNLGKVELVLGQKGAGDQQIAIAIHQDPSLRADAPPSS